MLSTTQLAELAGVEAVTVRDLEERGLLKPATGHTQHRRRWTRAHVAEIRRLLLAMPGLARLDLRFNPVLARGALAAAAPPIRKPTTPTQQEEPPMTATPTTPAFPEERWANRTKHKLLSTVTAKLTWEMWHRVRPDSKNDASAMKKIAAEISATPGRRPIGAGNVRGYLVALGLVEKLTGGYHKRTPSAVPYDTAPARPRRQRRDVKAGLEHELATAMAPERQRAALVNGATAMLALHMPIEELSGVVGLAKLIAEQKPTDKQRQWLAAWLQEGGR